MIAATACSATCRRTWPLGRRQGGSGRRQPARARCRRTSSAARCSGGPRGRPADDRPSVARSCRSSAGRGVGREREQIKWLLPAAALVVGASPLRAAPGRRASTSLGQPGSHRTRGWSRSRSAIAVLRYRLYEIDRIIGRTARLGARHRRCSAPPTSSRSSASSPCSLAGIQGTTLAMAASTLVSAALFQPLRRRGPAGRRSPLRPRRRRRRAARRRVRRSARATRSTWTLAGGETTARRERRRSSPVPWGSGSGGPPVMRRRVFLAAAGRRMARHGRQRRLPASRCASVDPVPVVENAFQLETGGLVAIAILAAA